MGLAQEQHGQPGLADAAAHGQGELAVQEHLVEGQLPALVAAGQGELLVQGLGAHPDAHGGQLDGLAVDAVPAQQVAVQVPVVVVGGPAVVGLARLQLAADAHEEGHRVLLHKGVLPLLGGKVGVAVLQLLGGDEGDLLRDLGQDGQLGEHGAQEGLGVPQGPHNGADSLLQVLCVPVLLGDDLLPVPLVHIGGVEVVQILVPADGVHIGVQALARVELVTLQGQALPLGQGVDHHGGVVHPPDVKGHRALHAVQVVVQAGGGRHEQGGGHPVEAQGPAEPVLEQALEQADGLLGLIDAEQGGIPLGDGSLSHSAMLLFLSDDRREPRGIAITQGIILNFSEKGNVRTIEFPDFSCRFVSFVLESICRGTARPNENGKKENHFDA